MTEGWPLMVTCKDCGKKYKWTRSTANYCGPCTRKHSKTPETACSICGGQSHGLLYCDACTGKFKEKARASGLRPYDELVAENLRHGVPPEQRGSRRR